MGKTKRYLIFFLLVVCPQLILAQELTFRDYDSRSLEVR